MSKKSKKADVPAEEIVQEEAAVVENTAEPQPEAATEENIAVSEEPENIDSKEADTEGSVGTISRPVNFRTGPSFKNAVITELKAGAKVAISGSEAGDKGKWYKCEFDGRTGYVKATGIVVDK